MHDERDDESFAPDDRLDRAISARLRKLRTMPVDTSSLEKRLRAELGAIAGPPSEPASRLRIGWLRFHRVAMAAVVMLAPALAASLLLTAGGPALGSAS